MDEDKNHTPVLRPVDENDPRAKKPRNRDEPEFFSENYRIKKVNPPYIFILLVIFVILGALWKMAVQKEDTTATEYAQFQKKLNDKKLKQQQFNQKNYRTTR